jgi:hypothetical protein
VREVIELTYGEAVKNRVSVRTQLAVGLPLIQGDRVQLQQVILNLILNAVQAMGAVTNDTREMLITTSQTEPNEVCLGVRDTGPGAEPGGPPASVRATLHDQTRGHGHGLIYLPLDHRSPRRTAVGDPVRTAGCSLSVYDPLLTELPSVIDVAFWPVGEIPTSPANVCSLGHFGTPGSALSGPLLTTADLLPLSLCLPLVECVASSVLDLEAGVASL